MPAPLDPSKESPLIERARELGYQAFMDCRHYSENPFRENDWQRYDAWDEGWAQADHENPGRFDPSSETFRAWPVALWSPPKDHN